jgi:glucose-6-phosphate isomerase
MSVPRSRGLTGSVACATLVEAAVRKLENHRVRARLWEKDYTLWKPSPAEIANRLGWLDCPRTMPGNVNRIREAADAVRTAGCTQALLLGMGGSSLAPEVFRKTFGVADGFLDVSVLDSTDPGAVLAFAGALDPARTLFIVSTKSGGTVETFSFMKYFFHRMVEKLGEREAGSHFLAITDPGSALADLAAAHRFHAVFLNDPDIGGRYSALSHFGLVPAALLGANIGLLLDRAAAVNTAERLDGREEGDPSDGLYLGAVMGALARTGRDKLTFVFSPSLAGFGDWLEQLIAESTGKEGKGIIPVVGEPLGSPDVYGDDRVFVHFHLEGESGEEGRIKRLEQAGHPVLTISLRDRYDLGGQIFLWEVATAVAGHLLEINPFDQPDVEAAKVLARGIIARYGEQGRLPGETPVLTGGGIDVYGDVQARSPGDALIAFLGHALPGGYIALQAYLEPTTGADDALVKLRTRLRDRMKLATTSGYGPRYLHSTGQLHKGGGGRGIFIQLTADDRYDAPIPDEMGPSGSSVTFGILKAAQAMGDRQALIHAGRPVIRFHLGRDVEGALKALTDAVS